MCTKEILSKPLSLKIMILCYGCAAIIMVVYAILEIVSALT